MIPGDNYLLLIVKDNGRGLDPLDRGDGDGIENLNKLLELVGGRCSQAP